MSQRLFCKSESLYYIIMYKRIIALDLCSRESCFLWGARQTGKSTLLRQLFPGARRYDLLLATEYRRLLTRPQLLREECDAAGLTGESQPAPIIIDEVQKVPALLDEIQWLIENRHLRFVLCGSSARKVKRGHGNLLGGRAVRYELLPLAYPEIPEFDLCRALNSGLLPRHYDSVCPRRLLQSYVGDYLKQEIAAEALTRNVPAFSRFLEVAAISNGELINYRNIAMECGVSGPTVKQYFEILEDTLLGRFLPAFLKRLKRRVIAAPKFFFFDVGVVNHLTRRGMIEPGSELFGRVFEHFIFMELTAHAAYSERFYPLAYWRTASGLEVDFVLGDAEIALEVKSSGAVHDGHLRGIRAFGQEHHPRRCIVVSLDPSRRRTVDGIDIVPWREFLDDLWQGRLVN